MYGWRGGTCQEEQSRCEGTEAAWMQVFIECSQSGEGGGWRACGGGGDGGGSHLTKLALICYCSVKKKKKSLWICPNLDSRGGRLFRGNRVSGP